TIIMSKGPFEELLPFEPTFDCNPGIAVAHDPREHRHIRIHRLPDWSALPLKSVVILVYPVARFAGIHKGKSQRPDSKACSEFQSVAVCTGGPDGRMRFL